MNRLVESAFATSGAGGVKDTSASVSETDLLTDVGRRQRLREKAEKNISYAHIGRQACGTAGEVLVAVALIITQLGFCVNYFIFVGCVRKFDEFGFSVAPLGIHVIGRLRPHACQN